MKSLKTENETDSWCGLKNQKVKSKKFFYFGMKNVIFLV